MILGKALHPLCHSREALSVFAGLQMEGKGKPSPGAARRCIPPPPDSWGSHLSPVGKKGCAVPKASGPRPRSPPRCPCSILQETHPLASSGFPLAWAHLSVPHLPSSSGGPVGRPVSPICLCDVPSAWSMAGAAGRPCVQPASTCPGCTWKLKRPGQQAPRCGGASREGTRAAIPVPTLSPRQGPGTTRLHFQKV